MRYNDRAVTVSHHDKEERGTGMCRGSPGTVDQITFSPRYGK